MNDTNFSGRPPQHEALLRRKAAGNLLAALGHAGVRNNWEYAAPLVAQLKGIASGKPGLLSAADVSAAAAEGEKYAARAEVEDAAAIHRLCTIAVMKGPGPSLVAAALPVAQDDPFSNRLPVENAARSRAAGEALQWLETFPRDDSALRQLMRVCPHFILAVHGLEEIKACDGAAQIPPVVVRNLWDYGKRLGERGHIIAAHDGFRGHNGWQQTLMEKGPVLIEGLAGRITSEPALTAAPEAARQRGQAR